MRPLCLVMLPQTDPAAEAGPKIDFDAVFDTLVAPALAAVGADPVRAVTPAAGASVPDRLLEQLVLCDLAVVDLTGADPSAFHAVGLREGIRPTGTVLLHAADQPAPLHTVRIATLAYRLASAGSPADAAKATRRLSEMLRPPHAGQPESAQPDWAVSQLVASTGSPPIARLTTDLFRPRTRYSVAARNELAAARQAGADTVRRVAGTLGAIDALEAGVVIDLLLSYRAVSDWGAMVALVGRLPRPLARVTLVREQLAFALNRLGRGDEAERLLRELIDERGPSSETCGLLGRVYKDRWQQALAAADAVQAVRWLTRAIDAYLQGFEADWRDAYPGINAVTLMELQEPPDARRHELLPVVAYAVRRRVACDAPDYWDHASLLELAVLQHDESAAMRAASDALAAVRESWEPQATALNLAMIREARAARGEAMDWPLRIEQTLKDRAAARASSAAQPHAD